MSKQSLAGGQAVLKLGGLLMPLRVYWGIRLKVTLFFCWLVLVREHVPSKEEAFKVRRIGGRRTYCMGETLQKKIRRLMLG